MSSQLVNYNGQLINLNGGVLANKFPIRDGLMLYVDSRIDACYPRTGTTVNDLSVSALSGTLANGVEHTPNKYFSTDGVDDYIEIPVSGDPTKTYTVNILARVTGKRLSSANQTYNRTSFFAFANSNISDGRGFRTFALQTWDSVDEYMQSFRGNGTSYGYPFGANLRFINGGFGDFQLYTIVYAPDITKLYINGSLHTQSSEYTLGNNGFDKVWIGTRWVTYYVEQSMQGDFAFFQMHERELSASEIRSIYDNVKQEYGKIIEGGLVLNLDADNYSSYFGSGTTWHDVSPQGNDAILRNGPTFQSDPPAIVFDSTDDRATIFDDNDVFQDDDPWTAIVAYKINDAFVTSDSNGLVGSVRYFPETDPGGWGMIIQRVNSTTTYLRIHLTIDDGVSLASQQKLFTTNLQHDEWYILAGSYNPDTSSVKAYVNGSLIGTLSVSNGWTVNKTNRLGQLHQAIQGGWNGIDYSASFGEVQIYKRTLSDDEIEYNFNARRGRYGI